MHAAQILDTLQDDGLIVELAGDGIKLAGTADSRNRWRQTVVENKAALIYELNARAKASVWWLLYR